MKCPKCSYIGFEEADRCRNCGYEFALSDAVPPTPDLPMRAGEGDGGPLVDLVLADDVAGDDRARRRASPPAKPRLDLDRIIGADPQTGDLPLFGEAPDPPGDLPPLIAAPAAPRRPLAVRRQTPQPVRARRPPADARESAGTLDLSLPDYVTADRRLRPAAIEEAAPLVLADPVRRLAAALVDILLLAGVHAVTIYFTLRLCGLTLGDWRVLPLVPLLAFFLLADGGYLVAFTTAGGQTIGKMALGLRVVRDEEDGVPVEVAFSRACGAIGSTVCLGAGLIPALLHQDRRALHDRLAGTHVVRLHA